MNKKQERDHAMFSPSSAFRWIKCPLSAVIADEAIVDDSSSSASEKGVAIHKAAETYIKTHGLKESFDKSKVDLRGVSEFIIPHLLRSVEFYYNYVKQFDFIRSTSEQRIDLSSVVMDCFGTVDFLGITKDALYVIDLKTGESQVSAFKNYQLMLYALGARRTLLKGKYKKLPVVLCIVQTSESASQFTVSKYEVSEHDFVMLEKEASLAQGKLATSDPSDPNSYTAGEHCQYCKIVSRCPLLEVKKNNIVEQYKDVDFIMTKEQASELLSVNGLFQSLVKRKDVRTVEEEILKGEYKNSLLKVVEGRSVSRWRKDAFDEISQMENGESLIKTTPSLVSITEAKKILSSEDLENLTYKAKSLNKVVPVAEKGKVVRFKTEAEQVRATAAVGNELNQALAGCGIAVKKEPSNIDLVKKN